MQEEYPKVVSEWESATIEMESLSLQLKKRSEQQEQLIDMLEKLRISIASKDNSLDDQKSLHIQKSLHKEKYSKLEKELESLKHAVLNAKAREKNAQIYLFNEVFSYHSTKCIERTCRQNMELLQHDLVIAQSMMDAKRKQLEVSTNYSESYSLRKEVSRLADNIEYKKLDMKTKSKILELCTILHSRISVRDQWCNAQQNYDELTIKIKKNQRDDLLLGRRDRDRMKILQAELLKSRDRELKTLQAFRSILTKIDMVGSWGGVT